MTCIPMTAADFVADLIRGQLSRSVEWRRDVPPVPADATPSAQLPPAVERFFEARLSELREHMQSLSAGDLYETWTHHVHSFDTPFAIQSSEHAPEVAETDTLALVREFPFHYVVSPRKDAVSIYHLDNRFDLSYDALPLVQGMVAHPAFEAGQVSQWLGGTFAWPDTRPLLQELVRAGILRVIRNNRDSLR
jgi:hypothetical protein